MAVAAFNPVQERSRAFFPRSYRGQNLKLIISSYTWDRKIMTMDSGNTSLRPAITAYLNPHLEYISANKKPIRQVERVREIP